MALTKGEAFQIVGQLLDRIGKAFEDDGRVSAAEISSILTATASHALKEYAD